MRPVLWLLLFAASFAGSAAIMACSVAIASAMVPA